MIPWCPGDILACYGTDAVSLGIRAVTSWPVDPWSRWNAPSHVALINRDPFHGDIVVESTTMCASPCFVRRVRRSGIQVQAIEHRIADYTDAGGKVEVYRLAGIHPLDSIEQDRLTHALGYLIEQGSTYDTLGAAISGTKLSRLVKLLNTNVGTTFCSELIAYVLIRLGRLNHENPIKFSPGRLIHELVRTGVYSLHATHLPQGVIRYATGPQLRIAGDA